MKTKHLRKEFNLRTTVTRRERDTILAALRFWQVRKSPSRLMRIHCEETAADFTRPLSSKGIDALCDRFNPFRVVRK